jgi:hypothetical protein
MWMRKLGLLLALLGTRGAAAQSLDDLELRTAFFSQTGRGFQSRAADRPDLAGSERATIWEPLFRLQLSDPTRTWTHDASLVVDVVSAASPDALDAISSASAVNEAVTLDITSTYHATSDERLSARYGIHFEEPFRSGWAGLGWSRDLADKNATIAVSGLVMVDLFDRLDWYGRRDGTTNRTTMTANVAASQVLSPTTLVDGSYGLTYQYGTLENTWNSVPLDGGMTRGGERFPGPRLRHAFAGRISQHVPQTSSTLKASYRFYVDNYGLDAHTAEVMAYQYIGPWLYLRGSYRYHWQSGVRFYGEMFPADTMEARTADSDLAPLHAHEWGVKLVMLAERSPLAALRRSSFDVSFFRYRRSNDLTVTMFVAAFGMRF